MYEKCCFVVQVVKKKTIVKSVWPETVFCLNLKMEGLCVWIKSVIWTVLYGKRPKIINVKILSNTFTSPRL